MSYLSHYGIPGMKWGVRRFQNADGTLTAAGKERYKNGKFVKAEKYVLSNCSNTYTKFRRQPISISGIKERAGINDSDAVRAANLASKKFDEAAAIEPRITKDVVNAVKNSGCKMYGLQYRLKQPTSMAGKIGSDAKEKGVSFEEATKGIKDAIRYTSVSDTKNFVKNYNAIKRTLEEAGYSETKCKNFFEKYKAGEAMHKAVQCTYKNPDGYEFELQFQTPSSQAAKELKIPIYEERRKVGISEERASILEAQMRALAENVDDPPYIETIGSGILKHSAFVSQKGIVMCNVLLKYGNVKLMDL